MTRHLSRFLPLLAIAAILAVSPVLAQKGKPKPPPEPEPEPPIKFRLQLIPSGDGEHGLGMNRPSAMNHSGHIVGVDGGGSVQFPRLYIEGTVWDVNERLNEHDRTQWLIQRASAINDASQVAGRAVYLGEDNEESGLTQGALYLFVMNYVDGSFQLLCNAAVEGGNLTIAGLNDDAVVCGHDGRGNHAFVFYPGDDSPTFLFADRSGTARDINNFGQIVGVRNSKAYRLTPDENGTLVQDVELGRIQDGKGISDRAAATSLNRWGEISGWAKGKASNKSSGSEGNKAFRYSDNEGMVAMTTIDSVAQDLNDRSDVVFDHVWSADTFVRLEEASGPVTVNLLTTGVVQGDASEVTRWRANWPYVTHINNDRVICGYLDDYNNPASFLFILTPLP